MFGSIYSIFAFVLLGGGLALAVLLALKLYQSPHRVEADADAVPETLTHQSSS